MAKSKKVADSREYVFSKPHEATAAAKEYSSDISPKTGKSVKWRVYKIECAEEEGHSYVVGKSKNSALFRVAGAKFKASELKKPKVDCSEFVSVLDESEIDTLLAAIEERKGE
jgi:hypothetical protein